MSAVSTRAVPSDVAFTPAVKAQQIARGSREAYARMEARGGWRTEIDDGLAAFIAEQTSCFLGTARVDTALIGGARRRGSRRPSRRRC